MHSITLSKEQMRKLIHIMASKGIYFPTTNELLEARKNLRSVVTRVLDGKGVQVQYKELTQMTAESILKVVSIDKSLDEDGSLEIVFKDGCDGVGQ